MGYAPYLPFTLGHEWAGEIVELGETVTDFKVGDCVAGEAHKGCGSCENCLNGRYTLCLNYGRAETGHRHYGFNCAGANCEYNAYSTKALHRIPDNLSYIHAALLDPTGVALHGIDMAGVVAGKTAAVWGPGPIGLIAMQIIKGMGASTVIMVGRKHRLKVAGELGADILVDFEKDDPVKKILEITGGKGVDIIQECSGANTALKECIGAIRKGGKINLTGNYHDADVVMPAITQLVLKEITLSGSRANPNVANRALNLLAKGVVNGDRIVSHTFPLEEYNKALDIFVNRKDNVIKVVMLPFPAEDKK
jgi:L-iditol 2-dehydrogenase